MPDIDSATGIWTLETAKKRHRHDHYLLAGILKFYTIREPRLVADLGCGDGWYCRMLSRIWKHAVVHGYEGTPGAASIGVYDDIFTIDLSKIRYVDIDYDFVLCLEVGEHIPCKHEQKFLDNVARFAKKDLVMSWAVPGQGGKGHFNEQPNTYILSQMEARGFSHQRKLTALLRKHTERKWFRNTVMSFERNRQ